MLRRFRQACLRLEALEARNLLSLFTPTQIRHAYGFDAVRFAGGGQTIPGDGRGQTIAIVDAFDAPGFVGSTSPTFAASDLAHFDRTFGLPDPPSFRKVNLGGTGAAADIGWVTEIALDVEWAHAVAPRANLLLVEAASDSNSDLLAAVDYARRQPGVAAVSMSWGSPEFAEETRADGRYFTTPAGHGGVTFVASSGDGSAWPGPLWPAVSPNVLAVGGSRLEVRSAAGAWSGEAGWGASGGGYSLYEGEPDYQKGVQASGLRTVPDVGYNADPDTGYYVYVTDSAGASGSWLRVGGTSAGAPQWAALVAIADQGLALAGKPSLDGPGQTLPAIYQLPDSDFHDVTGGFNGYRARAGYDLLTGRGSPIANRVIADLVKAGLGTPAAGKPAGRGAGHGSLAGPAHPGSIFRLAREPARVPALRSGPTLAAVVDFIAARMVHCPGGGTTTFPTGDSSQPAARPRAGMDGLEGNT
jgi:subtilase family serine protease